MHETGELLGAAKTESNTSLSHSMLGELFHHLPNVLLNKVAKGNESLHNQQVQPQ